VSEAFQKHMPIFFDTSSQMDYWAVSGRQIGMLF